ncbi:hypothetical protein HK103_002457 [Boothiomyces macroporosus]|uniref:Uncharacterized protein n=1 Tax=Boothiomyces macroporosus TaxID=261099 RepID=A0AAD5U9C9_9FUNG|nr:hypothetical protein HK103_002457 [Boothiomyces macroporosus]
MNTTKINIVPSSPVNSRPQSNKNSRTNSRQTSRANIAQKPPKIKFNLDNIKERKEFEPHFYKIQESQRLDNRLVNWYHKDVTATVGTYDPYPPTWEKTEKKSSWGKKSERFADKSNQIALGPGSYPHTDLYTPKPVASSFKSKTIRFKPPPSNQISPASYNLDSVHSVHTWRPWIETLSSRLGRMLDPPRIKKLSGTESQILQELSNTVVCKPAFNNELHKKQNHLSIKQDNILSKTTLNPYNPIYLVHSVNTNLPTLLPPNEEARCNYC